MQGTVSGLSYKFTMTLLQVPSVIPNYGSLCTTYYKPGTINPPACPYAPVYGTGGSAYAGNFDVCGPHNVSMMNFVTNVDFYYTGSNSSDSSITNAKVSFAVGGASWIDDRDTSGFKKVSCDLQSNEYIVSARIFPNTKNKDLTRRTVGGLSWTTSLGKTCKVPPDQNEEQLVSFPEVPRDYKNYDDLIAR